MMANYRHETPSGRFVGISAIGDPMAHRLVLLCHPTPGASGFDPDPLTTEHWGVHIVSIDRPGYGSSDAYTDDEPASLSQWVDDVDEYLQKAQGLANQISRADFTQIGVIGWGWGSVFALALASRHGDFVDRLALVNPRRPAPQSESVEDFLAHNLDQHLVDASDGLVDTRWEHTLHDALLNGDVGMRSDAAILRGDDWTQVLPKVRAETLLVHDADSADASRWLAELLPRAEVSAAPPGDGPTITRAWTRILEHVAPERGRLAADLRDGHADRNTPTPSTGSPPF